MSPLLFNVYMDAVMKEVKMGNDLFEILYIIFQKDVVQED